MAIIKGVKAADVSQVTPYVEDMDSLAKGIMARENRANATRDQIAANQAAILKQTRDHPEDMTKAQELEQGFKRDTEALVNAADRDYSNVSRDALQTLATDYAGKTDWRVLTEAKRNHDELITRKAALAAQGKQTWQSGFKDPIKDSAWNPDKTANNFSGEWDIEEVLDHADAAKSLFDEIGWKLKEIDKYSTIKIEDLPPFIDGNNVKHPNWFAWKEKLRTYDKDNYDRVNVIINNALDEFTRGGKKGAGNQYYRMHWEDAVKNQGMDRYGEEAKEYARKKVQELITTYGESEKIWEHKEHRDGQVVARAERPYEPKSLGGGKGSGSDEPPVKAPPPIVLSPTISSHGLPAQSDVFTEWQNLTSENLSVSTVTETVKTDYSLSNVKNNTLMLASAIAVENPHGTTGTTPGGKGHIYIAGQKWGSKTEENPTAIHFKHEDSEDWSNTDVSNYQRNYTKGDDIVIDDIVMTEDKLVEKLGDNLFTYNELRSAALKLQTKNPGLINNPADPFLKDMLGKKEASNISLSVYQLDPLTGEASVNELLPTLKIEYENKLANVKDVNSPEATLLRAKIKKIDNKIVTANDFKAKNEGVFQAVKNQSDLNRENTKIMEDNIRRAGANWGITDDVIDVFLEGKDAKGNKVDFKGNIQKARVEANDELDIYHNGVKSLVDGSVKNKTVTEEENKKYVDIIEGLWTQHVSALMNGQYSAEDHAKLGEDGLFMRSINNQPDVANYIKNTFSWTNPFSKQGSSGQSVYGKDPSSKFFESDSNGKYVPTKEAKSFYDNKYTESLKTSFKTNGNIVNFVNEVERMNDVINRQGAVLYKTVAANEKSTGWAENTFEGKAIRDARWSSQSEREWRKTKWETGTPEEFNKTIFRDKELAKWVAEKGTEVGFEEYLNKRLDESYRGIRLDTDNPGSLFVAHYEYEGQEFEYDVTIPMPTAISSFGVPALQFMLAKEIHEELDGNRKQYVDVDQLGFDKPVRIYQALTDQPNIKRGQWYIMHSTENIDNDPNAGNKTYHPNDDKMFKTAYNSFDDLYAKFAKDNGPQLTVLTNLKSNLWYLNKPNVMVKDVFLPGDPRHNMTKEQAIKATEEMISDVVNQGNRGASNPNNTSTTSTPGTINFQ